MNYYKVLDEEGFVVHVFESEEKHVYPNVIEITEDEYKTLEKTISWWIPQ